MRRLVTFAVCLCLAASATRAQTAQTESEKQRKEQEQKAQALFDELVESARALRLPENRAVLLGRAGDLLWPHDEKRARALLSEAGNTLTQLIHQPEDNPDAVEIHYPGRLAESRRQLLRLLLNRDPQLADEFFQASRPRDEGREGHFNADEEDSLELEIAQRLSEKDPRRLLQRAEQMLAAGKPLSQLNHILPRLRETNFEAAQKLTRLLVERFQSENPPSPDFSLAP